MVNGSEKRAESEAVVSGVDGDARVIAIDGPAGSGKSTVAKAVAAALGWTYVTTGAMYRTFGYLLSERGLTLSDREALGALANTLLSHYHQDSSSGRVFVGEREVTEVIRTPTVSEQASLVAKDAHVRQLLLPLQRKVVLSCGGAVVDGRDMGTVVFPSAFLKVFLDATPEERARRRSKELQEKGHETDFASIVREIFERDRRDAERDVAPLKAADDAVIIDSTGISPDDIVAKILHLAAARGLRVSA